MRIRGTGLGLRTLSRFALIGVIGGGAAGCSSDSTRLGDPFGSPFASNVASEPSATGSLPDDGEMAPAPVVRTSRIQSQSLGAPMSPRPLAAAPPMVTNRVASTEPGPGMVSGLNPDAGRGMAAPVSTPRAVPVAPPPRLQFNAAAKANEARAAEAKAAGAKAAEARRAAEAREARAEAARAEAARQDAVRHEAARKEAAQKEAEARKLADLKKQAEARKEAEAAKSSAKSAAKASAKSAPTLAAAKKPGEAAKTTAKVAEAKVEPVKVDPAKAKAEAARKAAEADAKLAKAEAAKVAARDAAKKVADAKAAEAAAKPAPVKVAAVAPAPEKVEPVSTGSVAAPVAEPDQSFRWPAKGRVISGYGSSGNEGINIAMPEGTAVKAAEDGTVAYAGSDVKGYGKLVLVRHTNGYVSAYAHNGELDVRPGEKVKRGQTIAKSGASGNVTSPQLHFEIRKGATPVDPMPHLASN